MSTALTAPLAVEIEKVLVGGDLKALTADQRVQYYNHVCNSIGLNPLTRPFDYINLNGKLVLYARKDCTDQLRALKGVSIYKVEQQETEGLYIVTAYASLKDGRQDADTGAVNIASLKGEARANAIMKAVTKAKRRCTLSICGLGFLDEVEVEMIPGAYRVVEDESGNLKAQEGTKEAQDEYLRGRGIERQKPVPAEVKAFADIEPEPPLIVHNLDPDTTHVPIDPAIKTIELRHAAQVAEADAVLNEVSGEKPKKRKRGSISFDALRRWKGLKEDLRRLLGTDDLYYKTLKTCGFDHADEIDTEENATRIWTVLNDERKRLKSNEELPPILAQSAEIIGQRAFSDLLGAHGVIGVAEVLLMTADARDALLAELKALVDARQASSV